jgi:hypothetical protein
MNRVLGYFRTPSRRAQYAVGRCLDAMGRKNDATGSYQAVVSGYPLEPEARRRRISPASPPSQNAARCGPAYFQIVLDRYVAQMEHPNLDMFRVGASRAGGRALCLLLRTIRQAIRAAGGSAAHAPPEDAAEQSPWRGAPHRRGRLRGPGALEAQRRSRLMRDFDHAVGVRDQAPAWSYARQGRDSLAIATEERSWPATAPAAPIVSSAYPTSRTTGSTRRTTRGRRRLRGLPEALSHRPEADAGALPGRPRVLA